MHLLLRHLQSPGDDGLLLDLPAAEITLLRVERGVRGLPAAEVAVLRIERGVCGLPVAHIADTRLAPIVRHHLRVAGAGRIVRLVVTHVTLRVH